MANSSYCVAASIEAKKYGMKTGALLFMEEESGKINLWRNPLNQFKVRAEAEPKKHEIPGRNY